MVGFVGGGSRSRSLSIPARLQACGGVCSMEGGVSIFSLRNRQLKTPTKNSNYQLAGEIEKFDDTTCVLFKTTYVFGKGQKPEKQTNKPEKMPTRTLERDSRTVRGNSQRTREEKKERFPEFTYVLCNIALCLCWTLTSVILEFNTLVAARLFSGDARLVCKAKSTVLARWYGKMLQIETWLLPVLSSSFFWVCHVHWNDLLDLLSAAHTCMPSVVFLGLNDDFGVP